MKIFICAGEPSGDMHAAALMRELKKIKSDIKFVGIGGNQMEQEGLTSIISIEKISVVGFVEVIKRLRLFLKLKKQCQKIMLHENVNSFIAVDYPGFNLKLAKFAKRHSIPVYYYIAPQVWAWGKNRWKQLQNIVTKLFVIFPFEENYFKNKGIDAQYVGHPLLNNPTFVEENVTKNESLRIDNLIALFPGSRKHEITKNLRLFIQTANIIKQYNDKVKFGIATSNNVDNIIYFNLLEGCQFDYELFDNSHELMLKARLGLVKVGTTTLEAALLNMNMVSAYNASCTHYWIGKKMINLKYISLPNILANKEIVPEYIQNDAKPTEIASNILKYMDNTEICKQQKIEYNNIRKMLSDNKLGGLVEMSSTIISSNNE